MLFHCEYLLLNRRLSPEQFCQDKKQYRQWVTLKSWGSLFLATQKEQLTKYHDIQRPSGNPMLSIIWSYRILKSDCNFKNFSYWYILNTLRITFSRTVFKSNKWKETTKKKASCFFAQPLQAANATEVKDSCPRGPEPLWPQGPVVLPGRTRPRAERPNCQQVRLMTSRDPTT